MLYSSFLTKKEIELKEVKDQDLILMNHTRVQILLGPRRRRRRLRLLTVCLFMTTILRVQRRHKRRRRRRL